MKKIVLFIAALWVLYSCGKLETENRVSVKFYNMPLENIKNLTKGKWKFVYADEGLCRNCRIYCETCFIEFTDDNMFINQNSKRIDSAKISWIRYNDPFAKKYNDSTYIINLHGYNLYVLQEIYFDTLIFRHFAVDGQTFHYIKSTN